MVDADTYAAIEQLQRAYADVATRAAWDEVTSLLTEDAHVRFVTSAGSTFDVDGAQAFAEFGAKMIAFAFFEYIPLNFVVFAGDDGALHGRSYSLEVAETEKGDWVESYSVYEDTYALVDGGWRFSQRSHRTVKQRTKGPGA